MRLPQYYTYLLIPDGEINKSFVIKCNLNPQLMEEVLEKFSNHCNATKVSYGSEELNEFLHELEVPSSLHYINKVFSF